MTVALVELLAGLLLVGTSTVATRNPEGKLNIVIDYFRLVAGVILILLAIIGGVKLV